MSESSLNDGAALIARLRTLVAHASTMLLRLSSVHPGPPMTSQERRRVAAQAETATAALSRTCDDFDRWHWSLVQDAGIPSQGDGDPTTFTGPVGSALADVSRADDSLARANADLHRAVDNARSAGASWREVGGALSITGQTAHKRFDPKARRRHADYMRERYQRLNGR